jgi:Tol biopolymer transport system component
MRHSLAILIAVVVAVLALPAVVAQKADQAEVQLKAAINKEVVDGDLKAAITEFQRIVNTPGVSRAVAARALLHLGQCHEKLGNADAQRSYEQLIANYPERTSEVAAARQRLAVITSPLRQENKSVAVRMLWKVGVQPLAADFVPGEVSPDGRYLTWSNEDTGDLEIRDPRTGQSRLLTNQGGWTIGSCWSPDGKQIAYGWLIEEQKPGMPTELRIADATGKNGTRVLHHGDRYLSPTGWFPDGKSILAVAGAKGGGTDIVRVSLDDGGMRVLKGFERGSRPTTVRLSPDGRHVAYELHADNAAPDIFLVPASGGSVIPLVTGPYDDRLLAWTPDGGHILFLSDRSGTYDAWLVRVENGKVAGIPELVKQDFGIVRPIGFTPGGEFYFGRVVVIHDILVADWNAQVGKLLSVPRMATEHFAGSTYWPAWSRDGKKLAYIVHRGALYMPASTQVRIRDLETGQEVTVPKVAGRTTSLSWSPDGKSLLLCGGPGGGRSSCRIVEVVSGSDLLEAIATQGEQTPTRGAVWAPDGSAVYYATWVTSEGRGRIMKRDLGTGKEEVLYSLDGSHNPIQLAASPDGKFLAFALVTFPKNVTEHRVMLLPTGRGDARELARVEPRNRLRAGTIDWSPDSRYVYFALGTRDAETDRLLRVSVSGGAPEELQFESKELSELRFSPDGSQIAFSQYFAKGAGHGELWVMENFLPPDKPQSPAAGQKVKK